MNDLQLLENLKKVDTPTITNVVATYPGRPYCLELYNPWTQNWYTDNRLGCWYPELGPICGYAVTAVWGVPDPNYDGLDMLDVLEAMDDSPKPVIFALEQRFPPEIADKVGLSGGNSTSKMMACGAVGAVTNGPSRDIHEVRPMGFQWMTRGICAGHGPQGPQAVQVPVHICGMDVSPGEIIHMDENGAVKFPADKLKEVHDLAFSLLEFEDKGVSAALGVKNQGLAELKKVLDGRDPYINRK